MKRLHYEKLKPICPCCKINSKISFLDLKIFSGNEEEILSGKFICRDDECNKIYPIIDGVPILVPDISGWLNANLHIIGSKPFVEPELEVLIERLVAPDSALAIIRQQQSSYCFNHYKNEIIKNTSRVDIKSGICPILTFLDLILERINVDKKPILDLGCAVGGATFRIAAQKKRVTLGIDQNWSLIEIAKNLLKFGKTSYSHRVIANEFDIRDIEFKAEASELVDFWAADALCLPFNDDCFGTLIASNLIDCVNDPRLLFENIAKVVCDDSQIFLTTPYDWSTHTTPPVNWIYDTKDFLSFMQDMNVYLQSRYAISLLHLYEPEDFLWTLHLHDRAIITYATELNILSVRKNTAISALMENNL